MDWYATLQKPSFTPPAIVFPIVWTTLYVLMAIAAWTFWRHAGSRGVAQDRGLSGSAFSSFSTLPGRSPSLVCTARLRGRWQSCFLLLAILITIVVFDRASRTASLLLVPYFLWVAFAAALNAGTFLLNRGS